MCTPAAAAAQAAPYMSVQTPVVISTYNPVRVLIYVGQLKNKTRGQRTEEDVKSFFRI